VRGLAALKAWAGRLKTEVLALWIGARDRRTPLAARMTAAAVAAYALSPIDLIPDFVPVLGYLDDLLILPLGIWLAVRLIPPELMAEFRERAAAARRPSGRAGAAAVIVLWIASAAGLGWLAWKALA
jgi:uncharacterized membrane protein YkvA (DUF1232 family)